MCATGQSTFESLNQTSARNNRGFLLLSSPAVVNNVHCEVARKCECTETPAMPACSTLNRWKNQCCDTEGRLPFCEEEVMRPNVVIHSFPSEPRERLLCSIMHESEEKIYISAIWRRCLWEQWPQNTSLLSPAIPAQRHFASVGRKKKTTRKRATSFSVDKSAWKLHRWSS